MKTKLFAVLVIASGLGALVARAQSTDAVAQAPAPQAAQVVYSPRLPSAAELTSASAAQGLTVEKIVQSASQMTLVYHTANGQTHTVAYQLLPTPGPVDHTAPETHVAPETHAALDATVAQPASPGPQVVYAQAPATQTVVYSAPAPAYYSPYYYPYYPAYYSPYYAPVAFSVGFGFGYYGGYYGHYHGGGYYHGGGGHGGHH